MHKINLGENVENITFSWKRYNTSDFYLSLSITKFLLKSLESTYILGFLVSLKN